MLKFHLVVEVALGVSSNQSRTCLQSLINPHLVVKGVLCNLVHRRKVLGLALRAQHVLSGGRPGGVSIGRQVQQRGKLTHAMCKL